MISINFQSTDYLQEFFLHPSSVEVESPLLSNDRIDESEISLSQFGQIRIFFDSEQSENPLVEKIFNWTKQNWQNCAYFFKPTWERKDDPYKVPSYPVYLTGWVLQKGGSKICPFQENAIVKTIEQLKAKGLPVSCDG